MDKDSDKLIELYNMAMDEYRFGVKLSWDAIRFFTTINVGILGFGSSILGLEQVSPKWITVPIFVIGIVLSILGIATRLQFQKAAYCLKKRGLSPSGNVEQFVETLQCEAKYIDNQ